jgi:hypothetical protein
VQDGAIDTPSKWIYDILRNNQELDLQVSDTSSSI